VKQHLEEAAVSQRDLQRVFNLLAFFIQHHNQRCQDLPQTVPQTTEGVVHRSLLLSLAVAYYFRLNRHLRHEFLVKMAELDATAMEADDNQLPCYDMAAVIEFELDLYIQAAELPQGIAPNQALRETSFALLSVWRPRLPWSSLAHQVKCFQEQLVASSVNTVISSDKWITCQLFCSRSCCSQASSELPFV